MEEGVLLWRRDPGLLLACILLLVTDLRKGPGPGAGSKEEQIVVVLPWWPNQPPSLAAGVLLTVQRNLRRVKVQVIQIQSCSKMEENAGLIPGQVMIASAAAKVAERFVQWQL